MNLQNYIKKIRDQFVSLSQHVISKASQFLKHQIFQVRVKMIGPMEKGFQKATLEVPPQGSYEGVDLSVLPKYIAYKSALLREKMTLYYILTAILILFISHYLISRLEISSLHGKLREKEYILAPGVLDFTKASPSNGSRLLYSRCGYGLSFNSWQYQCG